MRRPRPALLFGSLGLLLLAASLLATAVGSVRIPLGQPLTTTQLTILLQVRLPRIVVAALVGGGLASAGAAMQGLFRNPMADPGIIGVSAGGAFGAVAAMTSGLYGISFLSLPAAAFVGALTAAILVYSIAQGVGRGSPTALILTGMAMSALLGALTSLMITFAVYNQDVLREIVYWMSGGLEARSWQHVRQAGPPILIGLAVMLYFSRQLNLLQLGDEEAHALGVKVTATRRWLLFAAALTTGAAVAVSGTIGFVGLIIPHMLRLICGPDQRLLLPASALGGASFLILADTLARVIVEPAELRVGIITAVVGAPFFLWLLYRNRRAIAATS